MKSKITIKEIAERTHTSVASVHRALHGKKGISEETRKRILEEIKKSNYQVDEAASMLRRGELNITILLPKPTGDERFYFRGLWQSIYKMGDAVGKNKVDVKYAYSEEGIEGIAEALKNLYDHTDESLDGLLTVCDDEESKDWIERFMRRGTKVALIDHGVRIQGVVCSIETSSEDKGHLSANLLCSMAAQQAEQPIVLVQGAESRRSNQLYEKALREKILEIRSGQEILVIDGSNEEKCKKALQTLLEKREPAGILTANARTTLWACEAIEGLELNRQPILIGMDVFEELIPFFENGILKASIYQSHLESGEIALQCLYESLSNVSMQQKGEVFVRLSIAMKENYKYYL